MKTITATCLLALVAFAAAEDIFYTNRYDKIDLNQFIDNRRLLVAYLNCILDKGKCSSEGRELKIHIQEALENFCDKCTDRQREGTRRVIGHLINKEHDYWNQLTEKFDPERKYVTKYEDELKIVKT